MPRSGKGPQCRYGTFLCFSSSSSSSTAIAVNLTLAFLSRDPRPARYANRVVDQKNISSLIFICKRIKHIEKV